MRISIEAESRTSLFRVELNGKPVAQELTAAQAHILVGEILDRFVLHGKAPPRLPSNGP